MKPFDPSSSPYDLDTYLGRLRHFASITDARLLLREGEIADAQRLLEEFNATGQVPPGHTDAQLWDAKRLVDSAIHPQTGERILMPFRMSGFVPFGVPTVLGMLLPSTAASTALTVFWQTVNQTHNALVNWSNRNTSSSQKSSSSDQTRAFLTGYVAAVTGAVAVATGLQQLVRRAPSRYLAEKTRQTILRVIPFPAVATANVLNCVMMRQSELTEGITVTPVPPPPTHNTSSPPLVSRIAARRAVEETALTRALLPAPLLLIPSLAMIALDRSFPSLATPRHATSTRLLIQLGLCTVVFATALPATIALFNRESQMPVESLEADVREQLPPNTTHVAYDKGL